MYFYIHCVSFNTVHLFKKKKNILVFDYSYLFICIFIHISPLLCKNCTDYMQFISTKYRYKKL